MTEWEEGFTEGLALGQKLPIMPKQPTNIPVETIQATPSTLTLRPGDTGFIVFNITPANATIPRVVCRPSDPTVIAVNQFQSQWLVWQYQALTSGTAQIIVEAADGYGATTTINVNILGAIVFETCSKKSQYHAMFNMFINETLLVYEFTPLEADGKNIRIKMHDPLSGADSPYTVENTMFDNIKKIKARLESSNKQDYLSTSLNIQYDWDTTDGTDFKQTNQQLGQGDLIDTLYGDSRSDKLNLSVKLRPGQSSGILIRGQSLFGKQPSIEWQEGENFISIDNLYIIKALSDGVSKFIMKWADTKEWVVTVTVDSTYIARGIPGLKIVDEFGQNVYNNISGWYTEADNRYKVVPSGVQTIESIELDDSSKAEITSDCWIIPKAAGSITINVKRKFFNYSDTEEEDKEIIRLDVYSSRIRCGTVSSDYLKEGIGVWCSASYNVQYFNGLNQNKVDIIFNSNELSLLEDGIAIDGTSIDTVTFNKDGATKDGPTGRVRIYHFKKQVSGDVTIRFQNHYFPDIYDEVIV